MNSMDWQDYEDGLMSAEEKKQVDDLVAQEPRAASELSGLRSFRKAIRAKGLEEPVPMRRLDAMLCDVAGRRKNSAVTWQRLMVPVAAGLVLISAALFIAPFYLQVRPSERTVAVQDFDQAWEEAGRIMDRPMPPIQLAKMANVFEVKGTRSDYVCYEILMNGQKYCLRMSKGPLNRGNCSKVIVDGNAYFEKEDVAWSCAVTGLTYQVSGGTKEGRWKLATEVHREASS
jgi:hypothetical protein